jgi:hypothetical protein
MSCPILIGFKPLTGSPLLKAWIGDRGPFDSHCEEHETEFGRDTIVTSVRLSRANFNIFDDHIFTVSPEACCPPTVGTVNRMVCFFCVIEVESTGKFMRE